MAVEQGFFQPEAQFESDGDVSFKQKWDAIDSSKEVSCNVAGCFDCNICLETAHNPVVTLCGHLYCWPCIYKWIGVQGSSPDANYQKQDCPICKSNIALNTLVPLYGRGASPSESETKKPQLDLDVPRPRPPALNASITSASPASLRSQQFNPHFLQSQSFYDHQYFPNPYGGSSTTSLLNPTIVMLGELVFERVFGTSDMRRFPYPNSYTNRRMRRQEMQLDKSLSRVSIFFFCCLIICLLSF